MFTNGLVRSGLRPRGEVEGRFEVEELERDPAGAGVCLPCSGLVFALSLSQLRFELPSIASIGRSDDGVSPDRRRARGDEGGSELPSHRRVNRFRHDALRGDAVGRQKSGKLHFLYITGLTQRNTYVPRTRRTCQTLRGRNGQRGD